MEESVTISKLVEAQIRWNRDLIDNPDNYKPEGSIEATREYAENQIKVLLSFVK